MGSYTSGDPSDVKLVYTTFGYMLDKIASKQSDKNAHVFVYGESKERREVTFHMLMSKSLHLASSLLSRGLKSGSRVAVIGRPCPEYLYLEYALLRTKMLLIRIPDLFLNPGTLQEILQKYNCQCLVIGPGTDDQTLNKIDELLPGIVSGRSSSIHDSSLSLRNVFLMEPPKREGYNIETISALINDFNQDSSNILQVSQIQNSISPDDVALIMPTSGSTGLPKMTTSTHFAYINAFQDSLYKMFNLADPAAVCYNDRPFGWVGGMQFNSVISGCTMVYSDVTSMQTKYEIIEKEKVTSMLALPSFLYDAMQLFNIGTNPPTTLKYIVTGGERIPEKVLNFISDTFKNTTVAYASTETLAMSFRKLQRTMVHQKLQACPYVELKLVDDSGLVATGLPGELLVRSPFVSRGYLDEPKLDRDGWFSPGDVGKMDDDGFIEIVGRVKDIISKGGVKVHHIVVEDVLMRHPDIDIAAVIGVPDPRLFQEICACVIVKPNCTLSEEQLAKYCNENIVDKITLLPKYFWVMDKFPLGVTGKIDRGSLINMAVKRFNLETI